MNEKVVDVVIIVVYLPDVRYLVRPREALSGRSLLFLAPGYVFHELALIIVYGWLRLFLTHSSEFNRLLIELVNQTYRVKLTGSFRLILYVFETCRLELSLWDHDVLLNLLSHLRVF